MADVLHEMVLKRKPRVYREDRACFCIGCGKKIADSYKSTPFIWCDDCKKKNQKIHMDRYYQKAKMKEVVKAYSGLFLRMFPKGSQMVCYCCGKPVKFSGSVSSLICKDCKNKEVQENPNYLTYNPKLNNVFFNGDLSNPIPGESLSVFLSEYLVKDKAAPVNENSLNEYLAFALVRIPNFEKSDFIPDGKHIFCNGCAKPIVYENGSYLCEDCKQLREKKVNQVIVYAPRSVINEPIPLDTFLYLKKLSKANHVPLRKLYVMIYLANKRTLEEEEK